MAANVARTPVSQLLTTHEPRIRSFLEGVAATLVVILCILVWNDTSPWRDPHEAGQDYRNSILLPQDPNLSVLKYMPHLVMRELCHRKAYSMWGDPIDTDWESYGTKYSQFMSGCRNIHHPTAR
jgi:hypothetical protein